MAKTDPANHLQPFELISNGDFNPPNPPGGSYVSTLSLDGWTLGGGGRGAVIPAEIINSAYAGMPTGRHYFDTQASPGATVISQSVTAAANAPLHLDAEGYYQTFGGSAHTNMADSLAIDVAGVGFGAQHFEISFAQLFGVRDPSMLPAAGSHGHISLDFAGASDGHTTIQIHEVGPGAATGNIGIGLTGVSAHAYDVFNGVHY